MKRLLYELTSQVSLLLRNPRENLTPLSELLEDKSGGQRHYFYGWRRYTQNSLPGIETLWDQVAESILPLLDDPDEEIRK